MATVTHTVKCKFCGQSFNRDIIPFVKIKNRYAHKACFDETIAGGEMIPLAPPPEDKPKTDLVLLKDYISEILGDYANWSVIMEQITAYQKKGYSLTGMLKSLKYFYEIKKNTIDKEYSHIGIIPYCYQDAYNYYKNIYDIQQKLKDIKINSEKKTVRTKIIKNSGFRKQLINIE